MTFREKEGQWCPTGWGVSRVGFDGMNGREIDGFFGQLADGRSGFFRYGGPMRWRIWQFMATRRVRGALFSLGVTVLAGCQAPAPLAGPTTPAAAPVTARRVNAAAQSGDAFVILTGGGTPLSNEYSHYLQARAMTDFFRQRYPAEAVWTFFGIGNREGAPGILSDVHRQIKEGDLLVDTWLPGTLPNNRPATKESFLTALRDEILPRVAGGGTLYLFVGDHGELSPGKNGESAVTMWQLYRGRGGRGWNTDRRGILTVSDLRTAFASGLGQGRVVFCMTQCHSGGFHFLGVPRDVGATGTGALRVAGFAATDEDSLASGCMADPDPENWMGYERFIPEALLGVDLITGARRGGGLGSFAAAHEAATLVDRTIDKPYASSDQWLERWAEHIETKLMRSLAGSEREREALAVYANVADGRRVTDASDANLMRRVERFRRFTAELSRDNAATAKLLNGGTRRELEAAIRQPEAAPESGGRRRRQAPTGRLWTQTIRPAWKAAVLAGAVTGLPAAAVKFEKSILELEEKGRDFSSTLERQERLLNEVYWQSGLSNPVVTDRATADAVPRWAVVRRQRILEWAAASGSQAVRTAAAAIAKASPREEAGAPEPVVDVTAVERVLAYRRALAAWSYLLATNNRAALARLAELIEIENTPLPAPTLSRAADRAGQ